MAIEPLTVRPCGAMRDPPHAACCTAGEGAAEQLRALSVDASGTRHAPVSHARPVVVADCDQTGRQQLSRPELLWADREPLDEQTAGADPRHKDPCAGGVGRPIRVGVAEIERAGLGVVHDPVRRLDEEPETSCVGELSPVDREDEPVRVREREPSGAARAGRRAAAEEPECLVSVEDGVIEKAMVEPRQAGL